MENLGQKLTSPTVEQTHTVAVIGAGWAGCAAAVALAKNGHRVTLLEAARLPGGRARRVEQHDYKLDNGQHILLGAYRDSLQLMKTVGLKPSAMLRRYPLQMRYPPDCGGMDFIAPKLPAPLHLAWAMLRAKGLQTADKLALARFSSAARWMNWQLNNDCSVTQLLERFDQTERVIQLMWRPLCIAALNTPPERASAKVFLNVLRDSLGANRSASDMLLPLQDLSALFPEAAVRFIEKQHGKVEYGVRVREITRSGKRWLVTADQRTSEFDAVVLATPPWVTSDLMQTLDTSIASMRFDYEAITTCYLQYAPTVKLDRPFYALIDQPEHQQWGQFVFDRGQLHNDQAGLLAVVISASAEANEIGQENLCSKVSQQLANVLHRPELNTTLWHSVITEKRATFACTPDLKRPTNLTACENIVLAGDYTASDYPATIEGAVRSGLVAAKLLSQQK